MHKIDISEKDKPFANIDVDKDKVLIGAYEGGKIARRLFYMDEKQLELLINGLIAAKNLIKN